MQSNATALFLIALSIPAGALAADTQTLPPLVEQVEVSVINVDVTVTDRNGQPFTGLTRDDFEVYEDGRPQQITGFYAIQNAKVTAPEESQPISKRTEDQFRRRVVLMFDNNSVNKPQRDIAIRVAEKFIDNRFAGNYEWAVMSVGHGVETVQPFTTERSLIDAALLQVRHSPTFEIHREIDRSLLSDTSRRMLQEQEGDVTTYNIGDTVRFQSREQSLRSLRSTLDSARAVIQTCRAYSASAGKKLLVLVSGGMELNTTFSGYDSGTDRELLDMQRQMGQVLDTMVREANAANFSIYVVNPRGMQSLAPQHDVTNKSSGVFENMFQQGGLESSADISDRDSASLTLAMGTGGSYLPSNNIHQSLEKIDSATANFYSLGYSPGHHSDGKYHHIEVRLKRKDLKVHHREGYLDLSADKRLEQTLRAPMTFPKEKGTLPVRIDLGVPEDTQRVLSVPLTAVMPMSRITMFPQGDKYVGRVHVYLAIYDENGTNVGFHHQIETLSLTSAQHDNLGHAAFRYMQKVGLPRGGNYTVVLTLRDDISDEIGTAFQDVRL